MKKTKLPEKNTPQIREYMAAVRRGRKSQHIIKADEGWAVRSGGSARASRVFQTQKKATEYGKKITKQRKATLFIHGRDGRIKESYSYSR